MNAEKLAKYLAWALPRKYDVLVTGAPGVGKSDVLEAAAKAAKFELMILHPVVSEATDYKGLPAVGPSGDVAIFLPFGDLERLKNAKKLLCVLIEDLGQAERSVQAALMQMVLKREINGVKISDNVVFVAATNRAEDLAGVVQVLKPLVSRFTVVPFDVDLDVWCKWAANKGIPDTLISFLRFKPELLLDEGAPPKGIVNTYSPRTIANLGRQQADGLDEALYKDVFEAAAGRLFATEYLTFLQMYQKLPKIDTILINPDIAVVPEDLSALYAVCGGLARKASSKNVDNIYKYLKRVPVEFATVCVRDIANRNPKLAESKQFVEWVTLNNKAIA